MRTRLDVVNEARAWINTPWLHQASLNGVGADCLGLLNGIARELDLPDVFDPMSARGSPYRGYGREPNPELMDAGCDEYLDQIPVFKAGLGDILQMSFRGDRHPRHFVIISSLDPPRVIHAYAQMRKVVEMGAKIPGATVLKAYRFRGVE